MTADRVRLLLEILDDKGFLIPIGTTGHVVGAQGERLVVAFEDHDTGETRTASVEVWEVLRSRVKGEGGA